MAVAVLRQNTQWQGIIFLVAGLTLFSVQDVIVKEISTIYPVQQLTFIRSAISTSILAFIGWRIGRLGELKTQRIGIHILRGVLLIFSFTSYYLAVAAMPLAEAVAIYFISPIFTAILSVFLLKETFTRQHGIALTLGFGGTLVMLRPGVSVIEPAALLAIVAALMYSLSVMITRRTANTESGLAMAFYTMLTYGVVNGVFGVFFADGFVTESAHPSMQFLTRAWVMPTPIDALLFLAIGAIAAIGFYLLAQAYRVAEAVVIAPFEYVMLLFSIIWGFVFWRDVPDLFMGIGVVMIVVGGLTLLPLKPGRRRWLVRRSG